MGVSSPLRRSIGKHHPSDVASGDTAPRIAYEHVVWSPDGLQLAVTFELATQQPSVDGVMLMTVMAREHGCCYNISIPLPGFLPSGIWITWQGLRPLHVRSSPCPRL